MTGRSLAGALAAQHAQKHRVGFFTHRQGRETRGGRSLRGGSELPQKVRTAELSFCLDPELIRARKALECTCIGCTDRRESSVQIGDPTF